MFTRRQILSSSILAPLVAIIPSAAQARISTAAKKTKVCALTAVPALQVTTDRTSVYLSV